MTIQVRLKFHKMLRHQKGSNIFSNVLNFILPTIVLSDCYQSLFPGDIKGAFTNRNSRNFNIQVDRCMILIQKCVTNINLRSTLTRLFKTGQFDAFVVQDFIEVSAYSDNYQSLHFFENFAGKLQTGESTCPEFWNKHSIWIRVPENSSIFYNMSLAIPPVWIWPAKFFKKV